MRISKTFSRNLTLLILCLLLAGSAGCSSLLARASQSDTPKEVSVPRPPSRGLRIIDIYPGGEAERAGLERMDLIFRYGDHEIIDDASFYAARDVYETSGASKIAIQVWRNNKALKFQVAPGRLGIDSNEYSPVAYQFSATLDKLDAQRAISEYMRDREFKDSYVAPEKLVAEGRRFLDQAEQESTLTPNQILVARISLIADDAPPEDLKRQSELLAQLVSTQPVSYLHMMGQDEFFLKKRYRPAVACFKRYLDTNPNDVSIRLNLGVAYYRLRMFAEAEAAADYVLDNDLPLSDHGQEVAYNVKAMGVLSRGDYAQAIYVAEQAWESEPCHCDISLVMLAAAQTGNLEKLAAAARQYQQALPDEFAQRKLQLTAVEAFALVKSNQLERARALVRQWKDKDRVEGRLKAYWAIYPGGADVWNNWTNLERN